jgi:hypothetical protein
MTHPANEIGPNLTRILAKGSWEIVDLAGDRIVLFDGKNRRLELPSGSTLRVGGVDQVADFNELNQLDRATGIAATVGLGILGVAKATFDPSANEGQRTVAAHLLGVTIPDAAVIVGGFQQVVTAFTSAGSTATVAMHAQGANDLQTAAAVSGAPYSTTGLKAIVPKANTPETTGILLTAARELTATVAVEALTAGKAHIWVYYVR